MLKHAVFVTDLFDELLSSLLDLLFIDVESHQVDFDRSLYVFVQNVCYFEFPHPRVTHDLSDSSHGAQSPFGVLDQQSFEQHFDFWGEVDMIREVYIFVLN